jgi:hypothetical protein
MLFGIVLTLPNLVFNFKKKNEFLDQFYDHSFCLPT